MKGAEIIVQALIHAGVRYVAGVSGDSVLEVLDAMYENPAIEYIPVRHEQVGVAMADGFARVTGRPMAVITHVGPGALNLPIGLCNARKDSIPLLAISGNINSSKLGRDAWHDIDVVSLLRPVTKWNTECRSSAEVADVMRKAFYETAGGRPGPVHVSFPKDVLSGEVEPPDHYEPLDVCVPMERPEPDRKRMAHAAEMFLSSKRPLLFAGGGIQWSDACEELLAVAETTGTPVVTTDSARGAIPEDHPLSFGVVGSLGRVTPCEAMHRSDLILGIGARFSDISTIEWSLIGENVPIIQVDLDPNEIGRQYPSAYGIQGDAKRFLAGFLSEVQKRGGYSCRDREELATLPHIRELRKMVDREWEDLMDKDLTVKPILPQLILREAMGLLGTEGVVSVGAGTHTTFAGKFVMGRTRRMLRSVGLGQMGFAFPAAMGAKLALPDVPALVMVGDGDFAMVMQDLETAVRRNLAVVVVIFNDFSMGAVRHFQRVQQAGRYIGVEHGNPDFAQLARLFGAHGERVEDPERVRPALEAAFASGKPAVLDVIIDRNETPKSVRAFYQKFK
ncbi:MAG: thiamine pyrophosphate-binding protein [Candidatus Methylomirabilales bacterium]